MGQGGPRHDPVLPRGLLLHPATEPGCSAACCPARGLAVRDGLVAATMLTMGRLLPAGA
ncbi:hypothetical protein [Streptomyces chattanoogensis]|uniref:hypothetical protein n=1 Tax=Streptomyces chattanoogensis TaxID=66876 RepID=UPI0012FF1E68|nr:hypothetical protein [Streptomyces chattanoogensis]